MKKDFLSLLAGLTVVLIPNTSPAKPTGLTIQERVQAVRKTLTPPAVDNQASVTTAAATANHKEMLLAWLNWGNYYDGGFWQNFNQWGNF